MEIKKDNNNNSPIINFSTHYPDFRQVLSQDNTYYRNTPSPEQKTFEYNFNQNYSTGNSLTYDRLISAINPLLGEKYSNSKRLQKGYSDCSGFVNKVYKSLGKDLKGAASAQLYQMGSNIDLNQVQPGDLAFLTTTSNREVAGTVRRPGKDTSHVAIVLERQGTKIRVAESTGSQGTVIQWWEIGDPNKKEKGVINYANGSGRKNRFFGFRRLWN